MEREKLFSFIIPIYNVEKYLNQCLDSLLYQTVRDNFRVIMVNDGSTDRSGEIAKEYAEKYPDMFQYYEQENRGLGAARNAGFERAQTEYVSFLDSDDWLVARFVERVTKRLEDEGERPDLIYTLPCVYNMASHCFEEWMDKPLFEELFTDTNLVISAKEDPRIYALEPNANRKVYKTDFLRRQNFRFPEGTKWEDVEPHFQLLHAANRCIGEGSVGFCYRINSGNQITASTGWDRLQIVSVFSRAISYGFAHGWDAVEIAYIIKMMVSFSKWSVSFAFIEVRKELVKQLHELYKAIPRKAFHDYAAMLNISRKDRLYVKILCSPFYKILGVSTYYNKTYALAKKVARKLRRK